MTRQIRSIIIAVCVIAVLTTALIVLINLPPKKIIQGTSSSLQSAPPNVVSLDVTKVSTVHVTNALGQYTIKNIGDSKWSIDIFNNVPLNDNTISSAVGAISTLNSTELVDGNASNLEQFGLTKPLATVEVNGTDNTHYVIKIGNKAPLDQGYYAAKDGESKVYIVESLVGDDFTASPNSYILLTLTQVDPAKLTSLSKFVFSGSARTTPFELNIDATSVAAAASAASSASQETPLFNIVTPVKYNANTPSMDKLTASLQAINAGGIESFDVTDKSLENFGLKNPGYVFSYTYDKQETTLLFGKTFTKDGVDNVYVMYKGRNLVYSVATTAVPFYNWQLMDVTPSLLLVVNIADVKAATITAGTNSWKFDIDNSGTEMKITNNTKVLDLPNFRKYWMNIISFVPVNTATKPQNGEKILSIKYDYTDTSKASDVVDFYKIDAYKAFYSINGSGFYYVKTSVLDNIIKISPDIIAGKTILEPNT